MDLLSDILNTLNLQGTLYFRTDFSPPWALTVPAYNNVARFHLVVHGRCFVSVNGGDYIELAAGDMIMIPRGATHVLAHSRDAQPAPLERVLEESGYTGKGVLTVGAGDLNAATHLVCGHLSFRDKATHPIIESLPDYLLLTNACRAKYVLLDEVLRLITRLMSVEQLGSEASITRLSEILLIEMLKSGAHRDEQLEAKISAYQDPKIGQSLQLIHSKPDQPWTVESLASEVAMSRSRFAHRFNELVGTGPMSYLSDWRLQKALSLLENPRLSVQQIAAETGYQSPSAFSRAFSIKFGQAPSEYRQSA